MTKYHLQLNIILSNTWHLHKNQCLWNQVIHFFFNFSFTQKFNYDGICPKVVGVGVGVLVIETGIFADKLIITVINPIYKKNKKDDIANYRP